MKLTLRKLYFVLGIWVIVKLGFFLFLIGEAIKLMSVVHGIFAFAIFLMLMDKINKGIYDPVDKRIAKLIKEKGHNKGKKSVQSSKKRDLLEGLGLGVRLKIKPKD